MEATLSVEITMTADTLDALSRSGYALYGFKAVQCADLAGMPLVWFCTQRFSATTTLSWQDTYEGYTSGSAIAPGQRIDAGFAAPMLLGQLMEVGVGGVGSVRQGFVADALGFVNTTQNQYTCGMSQLYATTSALVCAFPLYGGHLQLITPLDQVVLMFTTTPFSAGQAVDMAYGPSIWIDMGSAAERSVAYDINLGWSWGGYSWAKAIAPASSLAPLLIQYSAYLARVTHIIHTLP